MRLLCLGLIFLVSIILSLVSVLSWRDEANIQSFSPLEDSYCLGLVKKDIEILVLVSVSPESLSQVLVLSFTKKRDSHGPGLISYNK